MGNPYTTTSVSNYNSNPPADDGTQTTSNQVKWATIKSKLPDPIKTAFDASETNTNTAFGKVMGGGGITSTATNYTVQVSDQGKFVKATVAALVITTPDATSVASPFVFALVNESTGDISLTGNNPGVQQNVDGATSITIPAGAGVLVNTDGTNWFTAGQNYTKTNITPQGRLTLVSATPVISSDQIGKSSVYYTPYQGDLIPLPNGTTFGIKEFSELTLSLVSNHLADTIYDVFVFLDPADNSTVRIGTGPAWSNSTAGSCARGSGAGTTQISLLKGFYVNTVAATMRNGSTTYSVLAASALYVGSIYTDHTAGQVTCHVAYGQNRKYGVWNYFNRKKVYLKAGDSTASWTYFTVTVRASNNTPASYSATNYNVGSGTAVNGLVVFSGLPEEEYYLKFNQRVANSSAGGGIQISIGINSVTTFYANAFIGSRYINTSDSTQGALIGPSEYVMPPAIGLNNIQCLEYCINATGTNTFYGSEAQMLMTAQWFA